MIEYFHCTKYLDVSMRALKICRTQSIIRTIHILNIAVLHRQRHMHSILISLGTTALQVILLLPSPIVTPPKIEIYKTVPIENVTKVTKCLFTTFISRRRSEQIFKSHGQIICKGMKMFKIKVTEEKVKMLPQKAKIYVLYYLLLYSME